MNERPQKNILKRTQPPVAPPPPTTANSNATQQAKQDPRAVAEDEQKRETGQSTFKSPSFTEGKETQKQMVLH